MGFRESTAVVRAQKTAMPEKTAKTRPSVSSKPPHEKQKIEFPESPENDSRLRRRFKHQAILGLLLNGSLRIQHGKVSRLVPERHKVGIMRAAGLPTLSGSVRDDRFIPIPHIQNFAIARTGDLVEIFT